MADLRECICGNESESAPDAPVAFGSGRGVLNGPIAMRPDRPFREHPYREFLPLVAKPARYTGGEVGASVRPWTDEVAKVCLAFPDVYDIGMSHLGFKILYRLLNDDPRTLAERCYTPWGDMESELRARGLPLVSLESHRPLRDFDVVGFSLQFELTYTNVLTMLDLGGIPLRASDRADSDPLVLAGGPTATHPEPLAPFIDAFVIGDGEEKATEVATTWTRLRREGVPRAERLAVLARLGAVYVPSLYETRLDSDTGLEVVAKARLEHLPLPVERSMVDINKYPFPDDTPTGGPEAIFDRMSIEIARGCTEGCRFCQAGMIYRPVRERDPEQIVNTVMRAVKRSGQDEVSLTALSTADVSCISPLIKRVAAKLSAERISLGVSSLLAYGLEPELLDELKRVRAAGLTFAPEAGTQRMRNVVNKNVTEDQLLETAERVFSRGWGKMKLYFMIGLPTETDEDVREIVETGIRAAEAGKRVASKGRPAEVTVSVSTHVPKPHTPFQWCAMDSRADVARKQGILKDTARKNRRVKLRTHDVDGSLLEGIFARGDRPLADVLERAWRHGARFDSWEDQLKLGVWQEALEHYEIDKSIYLGTIPTDARLPWDHIDVGLEDGFLAREYRKAMKDRLSPPCGKVVCTFVHHTNVEDAEADERRLVCYDCGIACDMTGMRRQRVAYLEQLGARTKVHLPIAASDAVVGEVAEPAPAAEGALRAPVALVPGNGTPHGGHRHRFRFEKTGAMSMLGHLDLVREFPRVLRRAGVGMEYTKGFHPKPNMTFAPALALGVMSLEEYVDIRLQERLDDDALAELVIRMSELSPAGLRFTGAKRLDSSEPTISKLVTGARYLLVFARSEGVGGAAAEAQLTERCESAMRASELPMRRTKGGRLASVDVRPYLVRAELAGPDAAAQILRAGLSADDDGGALLAVEVDVAITHQGSVRTSELVHLLVGQDLDVPVVALRVALRVGDAEDGRSALDLDCPQPAEESGDARQETAAV